MVHIGPYGPPSQVVHQSGPPSGPPPRIRKWRGIRIIRISRDYLGIVGDYLGLTRINPD